MPGLLTSDLHKLPLLSSATELFFLGMGIAFGECVDGAIRMIVRKVAFIEIESPAAQLATTTAAPRANLKVTDMRKLRRLPWRIPKSHNHQTPAQETTQPLPRNEPERESLREAANTQPVAFSGGRYVYGMAPSVACSTEIRRKARHRMVMPFGVTAPR